MFTTDDVRDTRVKAIYFHGNFPEYQDYYPATIIRVDNVIKQLYTVEFDAHDGYDKIIQRYVRHDEIQWDNTSINGSSSSNNNNNNNAMDISSDDIVDDIIDITVPKHDIQGKIWQDHDFRDGWPTPTELNQTLVGLYIDFGYSITPLHLPESFIYDDLQRNPFFEGVTREVVRCANPPENHWANREKRQHYFYVEDQHGKFS